MAGTALAISPRNRLFLQLVDEVIEVCMVTDSRQLRGKDNKPLPYAAAKKIKINALRQQLLMSPEDQNMPIAAYATFTPVQVKKEGDEAWRVDVEVFLPSDRAAGELRKIRARPMVQVDGISGLLPFFETHVSSEGNKTMMPYSHPCIVFAPMSQKDSVYLVAPLGLATEVSLAKWNNISQQKRDIMEGKPDELAKIEKDWPLIKHMPHDLLDNKRRYLIWEPQWYVGVGEGMPHGNFGFYFGQRVVDASDPSKPVLPGSSQAEFFQTHVFEITSISRNAIHVIWRGPVDKVKIQRGTIDFDTFTVDGFAALGLSLTDVDPHRVERFAQKLVASSKDDKNPLYRYCIQATMFESDASGYIKHQAMQRTAKAAVEQVMREFDSVYYETEGKLATADAPMYEEVIGKNEPWSVWHRESCPEGEADLVADVVARVLNQPFIWGSFLHMSLRWYLLLQIANRAGVTEPQRPEPSQVVVEEKPAEEVPEAPLPVETKVEDKAEEQHAAQEEAPAVKPKKPGKRKPKDEPAAPTA